MKKIIQLFLTAILFILSLLGSVIFFFWFLIVLDVKINSPEFENSFHDPNTRFHSRLGWEPIPDNHYEQWGGVSSNEYGFRSPEMEPGKPQIVLLGDSVAWGYGVSDEEHVGYFLQELLGPDVYVANLGVSGYGLGQAYLHLQRHIGKFDRLQAVVLVIYTQNDKQDTISNTRWGKRKPLFGVKNGKLTVLNPYLFKYNLRNLISSSPRLRALTENNATIAKVVNFIAGDKTLSGKDADETVRLLLSEIRNLTEQHGARFYVMLSAENYEPEWRSGDHAWFEKVLEEGSFNVTDFSDVFDSMENDERESFYVDMNHYNARGNRRFAQSIADFLDAP